MKNLKKVLSLVLALAMALSLMTVAFAKNLDSYTDADSVSAKYETAVVLVHNHPSGNPEPSHEDIVVTQRIADAGQIMEIPVLDHIIIGDGTFVSLCERGYV